MRTNIASSHILSIEPCRQLIDSAFVANRELLDEALALLLARGQVGDKAVLPMSLPDTGIGEAATLRQLAPLVLGGAQRLDGALAIAHMDPPTPWITWATTLWNASLNQNLLHPDTAPVARDLEALAVNWLAPLFGMNGGHLVPGSTVANRRSCDAFWGFSLQPG